MLIKFLWLLGASIFLGLGTIHLFYTFFTGKFNARNKDVVTGMKNTFPILTRRTTMWNAWIGFNASHSAGAMFMGLINIILVVQYYSIIQYGVLIHSLNLVTAIFYCWLGKRYWFRIPFIGISISTCCFLAVALLTWFSAQ